MAITRSGSSAPMTAAVLPSTAACPTNCPSASSSTKSATPARSRLPRCPRAARTRSLAMTCARAGTRSRWSKTSNSPSKTRPRRTRKHGREATGVDERVRARAEHAGGTLMSARNRELMALVPVALLLTAGFAAVFAQENSQLDNLSLTYGAYFFAVCLATHFYLRVRLPNADPYLFPLAALLMAFGLVMVYRIDASLARDQANWFVLGLVLF